MAKTKQFTISVDNHPGAVAHIAKTLGDAKVNILSLLGTAQGSAHARPGSITSYGSNAMR